MFAGATAARILAPATVALFLAIYKYYKSGGKTEVPDHMSPYPPGGGGGPPHLPDDRAPPDLDPAVVDKILNLVNAHLNANRNFNNPAVLDEILKLDRNSDPAILDKVEKLCLEENKPGEQEPACTNGPSSPTETESPTIVRGSRLDHAPSDLDPATLDEIRRLDPAVLDEMLKFGPLILDHIRNQKAVSFPPGECWTYLGTGTCKNRSSCKFKHPPRSKDNDKQVSKDKEKKKEELAEKPGRTESKNDFKSEGSKNGKAIKSNHSRGQPSVSPVGENFMGFPIPPVSKDKEKKKEELAEKPGRTENKNDFKSDGSKNGKASKSNHSRGQPSVTPVGENFRGFPIPLNDYWSEGRKTAKVRTSNHSRGQPSVAPAGENFLGLPIRPREKKCPYYMQNGSCKYGLNCKYNHPDPKAAEVSHPVSRYGNGGPASFPGASPSTVEPLSAPRSLNKTPRYVPPKVIPSSQWDPYTELNSYQAPANLPERSMPVPQPYGIDNSVTETITYQQHPLKKQVEESPERSGRPVSNIHSRSKLKNHHPKYRTSVSLSCELSDKGLPLRPGQNICTQYSTYGICNSGPSCKFDHPSLPTFTL